MVSQYTPDLGSWKILLKTCCLQCLIRCDTIQWWVELSDSCQCCPYLNTDPAVKLLTHYLDLYDLNSELSCFCCFSSLLNVFKT